MPSLSIKFWTKKAIFTVFYCNPEDKANSIGFQDFLINFERLHDQIRKENPYATFYTGDVNGHTQAWLPTGDTNEEGTKLDELFTSLNLSQLIDEPTHFFAMTVFPLALTLFWQISQIWLQTVVYVRH